MRARGIFRKSKRFVHSYSAHTRTLQRAVQRESIQEWRRGNFGIGRQLESGPRSGPNREEITDLIRQIVSKGKYHWLFHVNFLWMSKWHKIIVSTSLEHFVLIFTDLDKKAQPVTGLVVPQLKAEIVSNIEASSTAPKNTFAAVKAEPVDKIETTDLLDSDKEGDQKTALNDPLGENIVLTQKNPDPFLQHGM